MLYLQALFFFSFICINIGIIYFDIKERKIKNIFIILLFFLYGMSYFLFPYIWNIEISIIMALFFLFFIIFYYKWAFPAGDLKYLLVLSLLAHHHFLIFIICLSLLVLIKTFVAYLKYITYYISDKWKGITSSFFQVDWKQWWLRFWIVFCLFQIFSIFSSDISIFQEYQILSWFLTFALLYWIFWVFWYIKKYFYAEIFFFLFCIFFATYLVLLITWFINFVFLEWLYFLWAFIIFRFIIESISFTLKQMWEQFIDISNLKQWDTVDREFLFQIIGRNKNILKYLREKEIIRWNLFFRKIQNPINQRICEKLQNIYALVDEYNIQNNTQLKDQSKDQPKDLSQIKIFQSYSFAPYIFTAFMLSYMYYNIFL